MSTNNEMTEPESTAKMKPPDDPILFSNNSEDFEMELDFNNFHLFWKELEVYVRSLLIDCPEETTDAWYKKWKALANFKLSEPQQSSQMITLCIMESFDNEFTIVDVLEALTMQIPYLANHIYFSSVDTKVIIKLKIFQSYDFQNPFHIQAFNDPTNSYNAFCANNNNSIDGNNEKTSVSDNDGNNEKTSVSGNEPKNEIEPSSPTHADSVNVENASESQMMDNDNLKNESMKSSMDETPRQNEDRKKSPVEQTTMSKVMELDDNTDSLLSYSLDSQEVGAEAATSSRSKRKQNSLKSFIVDTCQKELKSMQTTMISEFKSVLNQHLQSLSPHPSSTPTPVHMTMSQNEI